MLKIKKATEENKIDGLLKPKINNFLIEYFGYLVLGAAIIVFAIGLWLFIYPQYRQIAKEDETVRKNLQTEYEAKTEYLNFIVNLKKSYQSISEEDKKRLEILVPAEKDVNGLIYTLEAIALRNGVILNSLKIEPEDAKGQAGVRPQAVENKDAGAGVFDQLPAGAGRVKIEVNLSSVNYQILKNVIETFENNLRLLDIAKINYNVDENKINLNVYSYYLPR